MEKIKQKKAKSQSAFCYITQQKDICYHFTKIG